MAPVGAFQLADAFLVPLMTKSTALETRPTRRTLACWCQIGTYLPSV